MHARVVTNQLQPGKADEWAALFRDTIVPASSKQKGFRGALALTDPHNGRSIGITFWDNEAALQATESSSSYQEQIAKVIPVLVGSPARDTYELRFELFL